MSRSDELRFRAGSAHLAGTLELPATAVDGERLPWALLLPSWLPRERDGRFDRDRHPSWFADDDGRPGLLARLATALAAVNVASLRYDKRGCGASDGDWAEVDLFTLIDDARDAIGAMRGRRELDLRRMAIVGHGEGATIALSVAIGDPTVSALTLVGAPARGLRGVLRRGVAARERSGVDREHPIVATLDIVAEELIERAERREPEMTVRLRGGLQPRLGLAGWEQAIHTPALALATMLHRSVALVHGSDDAWVHPDEAGLLAAGLPSGGSDAIRLVPGAGHDLAAADDAVLADLAADLAARISPVELPPVLLAIEEMGQSG